MQLRDQLNLVMEARAPVRFHTVPVLRPQHIDAHSWGVAMFVYLLYGQEEPGIRTQLLMAALCHDAAEYRFGDLPAPAKRTMGARLPMQEGEDFKTHWDSMEEEYLAAFGLNWDETLTDEERRRLKFCDALDGILYVVHERALGNTALNECFDNFRRYLQELLVEEDTPFSRNERDAIQYVHTAWSRANAS